MKQKENKWRNSAKEEERNWERGTVNTILMDVANKVKPATPATLSSGKTDNNNREQLHFLIYHILWKRTHWEKDFAQISF